MFSSLKSLFQIFRLPVLLFCGWVVLLDTSQAERVLYEQRLPLRPFPVIVHGMIGGKSGEIVFDTGAGLQGTDSSLADCLGQAESVLLIHGPEGAQNMKVYEAPPLKFGDWTVPPWKTVVKDLSPFSEIIGVPLRAVASPGSMQKLAVEYDFSRRRFRVIEGYVGPENARPYSASQNGKEHEISYLEITESDIHQTSSFRVAIGGVTITAHVDTGSNGGVGLRHEDFKWFLATGMIKEDANSPFWKSETVTGTSIPKSGTFTKGTLLGMDLTGMRVVDSGSHTLLGMEFLLNYNFVLDYAHRRFYFERRKTDPPIKVYAMFGAVFLFTNGHCRIEEVLDAGAASKAGIRKGDILLRLVSLEEKDLTLFSIYDLCETQAGKTIEVELSRSGGKEVVKTKLSLPEKKFVYPPRH